MNKPDTTPLVRFLPGGMQGWVTRGDRVDQAARKLGVDLQSVCGGQGTCGKCKVRLLPQAGTDSLQSALSPPTKQEEKCLSAEELVRGWRLACQSRVLGDATFDIPEESRSGGQVIRKPAGAIFVDCDPLVEARTVSVPAPNLSSPASDWKRLSAQINLGEMRTDLHPDPGMLAVLPKVLACGGETTALIRNDGECIGVAPGSGRPLTGLALDIGTTTLAAYLCDLENGEVLATASTVNPQISCGEDVISRIAHASNEVNGQIELQQLVIGAVNQLLASVCIQADTTIDSVADIACVANTCMHHLFLGLDPRGLGKAPFAPVTTMGLDIKARDLGIQASPGAWVYMLPAVSAFVGSDTVGVMLALDDPSVDETVLVIDVGTNGEIVLVSGDRLVCTSCATGPALEGATLVCGMRAAPGAIERISIDKETLDVDYQVIGKETGKPIPAAGICGSGVIDAISAMFTSGVIKKNGTFDRQLTIPRLKQNGNDASFVIAPARESAGDRDIAIGQDDIRAVQMAKGAIHAGVRLLMAEVGIQSVDRVVLAGAFGSVIDPLSALTIGLLPDVSSDKIVAVGNAAGDGARIALANRSMRERASLMAEKMETVELTTHPDFQREFAMAMYLPHMKPNRSSIL